MLFQELHECGDPLLELSEEEEESSSGYPIVDRMTQIASKSGDKLVIGRESVKVFSSEQLARRQISMGDATIKPASPSSSEHPASHQVNFSSGQPIRPCLQHQPEIKINQPTRNPFHGNPNGKAKLTAHTSNETANSLHKNSQISKSNINNDADAIKSSKPSRNKIKSLCSQS